VEALSRWLDAFGWEPTVITATRDGAPDTYMQTPDPSWMARVTSGQQTPVFQTVARRRFPLLQTIKSFMRRFPPWHDEYSGWSQSVAPTAIAVGRERAVDLVWVTCNPFSSVETALATGRALGVPVVVDLRDQFSDYLLPGHWFFHAMRQVDAVTLAAPVCVTPPLRAVLGDRPAYPIISGTWLTDPIASRRTERFTLLHAGTLYDTRCSPEPLFQAIQQLSAEVPGFREDVVIRFAGADSPAVTRAPSYAAVADRVEILGQLPHRQVLDMLTEASVLLIIKAHGDDVYSADPIPAKWFEYFRTTVPLLSFGGTPGIFAPLLTWGGGGLYAQSVAEIATFLRAQYLRWKTDGITQASRNPEALDYLTQRRMAAEFAEVFNALVEHRPITCRATLPWEA
jgi:hypothetical protein